MGGKKRLTTDTFVSRAKEKHGNRYDYSKVGYTNIHTKVCIICPEHGEFWQRPNEHMNGCGCPKCCGKNKTTQEFIAEAKRIHGDKYGYSKVEYANATTKVCITCFTHGDFYQTPNAHLRGIGCPMCAHNAPVNTEEFIKRARVVHGKKYDYSKTTYTRAKNKVIITCPLHGDFEQEAFSHLSGCGCLSCKVERSRTFNLGGALIESGRNVIHNKKQTKERRNWLAMMRRCYDPKNNRNKSYSDCSVCDEWKAFSVFERWYSQNYVEGWHLDKDILVKGNREYSPDKCCFVPNEINCLFRRRTKEETKRRKAPLLAEKYKDKLDIRVYNKLCNYK